MMNLGQKILRQGRTVDMSSANLAWSTTQQTLFTPGDTLPCPCLCHAQARSAMASVYLLFLSGRLIESPHCSLPLMPLSSQRSRPGQLWDPTWSSAPTQDAQCRSRGLPMPVHSFGTESQAPTLNPSPVESSALTARTQSAHPASPPMITSVSAASSTNRFQATNMHRKTLR